MKKRVVNWKVLIICLVLIYLVAFIGSLFTSPNTNTDWYNQIKPSITPPSFIFPIVWNILFFLIGISLYLSWVNSKIKEKKRLAWIFGINFVLNILWSVLYFGLKNPLLAFIEILILIISIVLMLIATYKINRISYYLLYPYLAWVCFASILNFLSF